MQKNLQITLATIQDISSIINLVKEVFDIDVAPSYTEEGQYEFYKYLEKDVLAKRLETNHKILLAKQNDILVGLIEVRDMDHISLFFVSKQHQGKGIGKALIKEALELIRKEGKTSKVSVNSSPNARGAYEYFGFKVIESEKISNGIRYIPMELKLD